MLNEAKLERILSRAPSLTIGVAGDLFLDRYLEIDASLTEASVETGLDAFQIVSVRNSPGAAGTVINNLIAFGVGAVLPVSIIGEDGEGYELKKALAQMPGVDLAGIVQHPRRWTPTYTKPMLHRPNEVSQELNRLDIKNRQPIPREIEDVLLRLVAETWPRVDALLVLDQVSEPECGVVTKRMRELLGEFGQQTPDKLILADSRERIGSFRSVTIKPNERECLRAGSGTARPDNNVKLAALQLAAQTNRAVFCTLGDQGMLVADPNNQSAVTKLIPAYPVEGPLDIVGAGDSTSAAIACAVAAGTTLEEAAAFGNLVASITIQQIGTTGTATPQEIRRRWRNASQRMS